MPELPEVETIKNVLKPHLIGRTIIAVTINNGSVVARIEPFDITLDYIKIKFGKSKKTLKELLLDQSIIAGIGNIYSDEICFAAKILPEKSGYNLSETELKRLCEAIPYRLTYFIGKNEITFEEYALTKGKDYRNTPYLQVYGKSKKSCPICGETLICKTIGGRSSVFCRNCQR